MQRPSKIVQLGLILIMTAACSSPKYEGRIPPPPTSEPAAIDIPATPLSVTATPLLAGQRSVAETPKQPAQAVGSERTNLPLDPLQFLFPTAVAKPVSLWRPPLYPVPWEPSPQDHFYFIRPIGADQINWPLAKYRYGYLLYSEPHSGVDIPAPKGTPILAVGSGTVIFAGYGLYLTSEEYRDPYGIAVAIKHDFGYRGKMLYTVYGHMDKTFVYQGQRVEAGETIGLVGETGKVSGPHLHLEIRVGDQKFFATRNPELWIAPPQGYGILVGRIMENNSRMAPQVKVKLRSDALSLGYEVLTYAENVKSDEYYKENLVLGDLPASSYNLALEYDLNVYKTDELVIRAGQVTFFTFNRKDGFIWVRPPAPGAKFIPPDEAPVRKEGEILLSP